MAALALHCLLLFIKLNSNILPAQSIQQSISIKLVKETPPEKTAEPDKQIEQDLATKTVDELIDEVTNKTNNEKPQELPEELLPTTASETSPENPTEKAVQNSDILTNNSEEKQKPIFVPSINSEDFRRFLKNETDNKISANPEDVDTFSNTFTLPVKPQPKDIKNETGPLGGGSYNVRSNGMLCQTLRMVPTSFEEVSGNARLISTIGNCKELNKKIGLLDKNGKIRNSDRYEE